MYSWLIQADVLCRNNRVNEGLNLVYSHLNTLCSRGSFSDVNQLLDGCDVDKYCDDILFALILFGSNFRKDLSSWDSFYTRAYEYIDISESGKKGLFSLVDYKLMSSDSSEN
jgi:hypothetical protein